MYKRQGYSSFTKPDQDSYGYYEDRPPLRSGGLAIASLVLCILGAVSCCAPFFSIPLCIAGIVCGALGLKSDKRTMAMVSMIISIVFLVISIALLIYSIALIPYMDAVSYTHLLWPCFCCWARWSARC